LSRDQTYILNVSNNEGCIGKDTLVIKVYKGPEVYVPNAFTPNNDGHNDLFRLVAPGIKTLYFLKVFNRWGQLVFETSNLKKGWDGRTNGQLQPAGAYVWMLKAEDQDNRSISKKGTLMLIR